MSGYLDDIEGAVRAVTFHSPVRFSWFDLPSPALPASALRNLTPPLLRQYTHDLLQKQLYRSFYCPGMAIHDQKDLPPPDDSEFLELLAQANSGTGCWEGGWRVVAAHGDLLFARKGEVGIWVRSAEYRPSPLVSDRSANEYEYLEILLPKECRFLSPGFYMAFSNNPLPDDVGLWLRLYWNVTRAGAVDLVRHVTQHLNALRVPFRLKVLNHIEHVMRTDAAVLYLDRRDWPLVRELVSNLYGYLFDRMRSSVPALTKRLAPGLGLAEDPGNGSSFGLHRCGILAEGLLRSYEVGKHHLNERLEIVTQCYSEANISLKKPYLRGDSTVEYSLSPEPVLSGASSSAYLRDEWTHNGSIPKVIDYGQQVVVNICRKLTNRAIWHAGLCNWLEPGVSTEHLMNASNGGPVVKALGPDMYKGTSGVALFLGSALALTDDQEVRRACLGAINHALSCYRLMPPSSRIGLYTGWVGVAVAAAHLGRLLGESHLLERAEVIVRELQAELPGREHDFLSGQAGAIVGLLTLHKSLGLRICLDLALSLGGTLLEAAIPDSGGYSWRSMNVQNSRNLMGLSHGAAGIGLALLELYAETGQADFGRAAELAFAYERQGFNSLAQNWPDYRRSDQNDLRLMCKPTPRYTATWCHGAPGIALSRIRAHQLLGEGQYRDEAITGLRTTRRAIVAIVAEQPRDFCLCHGLAGLAEVLSHQFLLGEPVEEVDRHLLEHVAWYGAEQFGGIDTSWPLGGHSTEAPGLMTGLSGIGSFYMRLLQSSSPSVLSMQFNHSIDGEHVLPGGRRDILLD